MASVSEYLVAGIPFIPFSHWQTILEENILEHYILSNLSHSCVTLADFAARAFHCRLACRLVLAISLYPSPALCHSLNHYLSPLLSSITPLSLLTVLTHLLLSEEFLDAKEHDEETEVFR